MLEQREINTQTITFETFDNKIITMTQEDFKQKVEAMLIAWAIWDALWVPVEMKSREYIQKNYGRLWEYLPSRLNIFFNKWWLLTDESWLVSDDTILTFSWVKSLLKMGKIDFDDLTKTSISDYKNFPYGFWRWTREAFERYEQWTPYTETWDENSAWNWVVMKQSPYAAYFLVEWEKESIDYDLAVLTKITHASSVAIIASLVHNRFLIELLKSKDELDFSSFFNELVKYSENLEYEYYDAENLHEVSNLLKELKNDYDSGWLSDEKILEKYGWWDKKIYASWYVLITLGICYSVFLRNQNLKWFLDSINIGWDTDTFASIVWNMIGAYKWKFYQEYYEKWLQNFSEYKDKVNEFNNFLTIKNLEKDIRELRFRDEALFYNSEWTKRAFQLWVRNLWSAWDWYIETKYHWKTRKIIRDDDWYTKVLKDFYLVDFENNNIVLVKSWDKLKIEVLKSLSDYYYE